ncbi:ankyrin repeat domain-containing protein SOWAHB [Pygocentrus nattereri]|uniref:SOWAHA-C winged helix-turn-helix domain-containing protein n=1 Tax=Pygocentrus nattereri TaxID=42514 RepID=A0A3B4D3F3_PYGNA|nr:ankyrin repeat domain-containing protein SOWAHB [Pygocentrus nattereri]
MAASQGLVLAFLLERGGKVRNSELLGAFRDFISSSEPAERRRNRDLFKNFVNSVAVVKQVDDVKYVVVKKKYQELLQGRKTVEEKPETPGSVLGTPSSTSCTTTTTTTRHSSSNERLNASCCTGHAGSLSMKPQVQMRRSLDGDPGMISPATKTRTSLDDSLTATVLNVSHGTIGKTGAVFAVVAIKSPPSPHLKPEKVHSERVNVFPKAPHDLAAQRQLPFGVLPQPFAGKSEAVGCSSSYLSSAEGRLYRSLRSKRRHSVGPSSPAPSRSSRLTQPGSGAKDLALIPLERQEHDWLVKSATGRWGQVYSLLLQDAELAEKKNFISGFTVLHWAAKKGNSKVLRQILDVSRQGGLEVDVNAKSHDGYTPLHIAAIHSQESVLNLLVCIYRANCNIRDNSGKKPYHYLHRDVSPEMREMLGDPRVSHQVAEHGHSDDDKHFSDVPKGLSTFSKLFQPSVGHRKKPRLWPSFHFISDDPDENRKDCATFNRRPLH